MKSNKGFTLIELVVVIVILGILAVTAVPRFIDLTTEANQAAADGVAGAVSSGMAVNYAGCVSTTPPYDDTSANCVAVDDCADAGTVLNDAAVLGDYTITGGATGVPGSTQACTLTLDSDNTITSTFTAIDTTP